MVDLEEVARRVAALRVRHEALVDRLRAAGGEDVTVLAVSKGHPVEAAVAATQLGMTMLGENYAQELQGKAAAISDLQTGAGNQTSTGSESDQAVRWHFIGQLQTNKVRLIVDSVAVWQSVDRLKVGKEIAKRAPGATVFAQVNLSEQPQKAGCNFDNLDALVEELHALELNVDGLMGVGAAADDQATAAGFARLRSATDRLGLAHCSMGMTADLELAVGEGSTMVRIGSDLFGPRP